MDEICQGLTIKPSQCENIKELRAIDGGFSGRDSDTKGINAWFAIKVIIFVNLIACVSIIIFYVVYKIKLRKEFEWRKDQEIDSALSNYYMQNRTEMNLEMKNNSDDENDDD